MTEPRPTPDPDATPDAEAPPRKKRRWLRWMLVIAAALVVLLGVFVALLPTLLSTGAGTSFVANRIGGQIDGSAEIRDLSLGWGGPTRVIGASVYDPDGRRVVELGELSTDAGVWGLITGGMRGELALGDTVIRGSLPVVELYPDGTTNLDRVFGDMLASDSDSTTRVTGDISIDFKVTMQRVSGPLSDENREVGEVVEAWIQETNVRLGEDGSIANDLSLALRVDSADAGSLQVVGDANAEAGSIDQTIAMSGLDLESLTLMIRALDVAEVAYDAAGTLDGEFELDSAAGTLGGGLTIDAFALRPVEGGEGYASEKVTLNLTGRFDEAANTASIEELRLEAAGDGAATLAAVLDLPTEERPAGPLSLRDIEIDVQTPYLTVTDSGPAQSIGGLDLTIAADLDAVQQRFGDLIGEGVALGGAMNGTVKTRVNGGAIQGAIRIDGTNVRYADNGGEEGQRRELMLAKTSLFVVPTLTPKDQSLEVASVLVRAGAEDAAGPIASLDATLSGIVPAEQEGDVTAIGSILLKEATIRNAQRFAATFGDFAELPAFESDPGPIAVSGTLAYDGGASTVEPVVVAVNGTTIARIESLKYAAPEEGDASVRAEFSLPDLSATKPLLVALGSLQASEAAPTGAMRVAFDGTFDSENAMSTLAGEGSLSLTDVVAKGASVSGEVPIRAGGGIVGVPADAAPLVANDGELAIAGMQLNLDTMRLTSPESQLAAGVNLNPVLLDFLGQFVHPVLTEPQEAGGLLDIRLDGPLDLNLSDPFGPDGGSMAVTFNIRDFRVDNDVIGELVQEVANQAAGVAEGQLGALRNIPGLSGQAQAALAKLDLDEEVRDELSSLRGSVPDSEFRLAAGTVSTRVTFDVADWRASASEGGGETYAVTFAGSVNAQSLGLDLSTTVPTNLVEKWLGENPDYLVEYLGDRPIRRVMPDGFTLALTGTTRQPRVDAMRSINQIVPRAVNAAVERQAGDLLNDPAKAIDRFRGLFD